MNRYWTKAGLDRRLNRRRALRGAAALAAGAVAGGLAACGGGEDGAGELKDTSGLVYTPVDRSKGAVKGGKLQSFYAQEPLNYDQLSSSSQFTFGHANHAYSRFFMLTSGTREDAPSTEPIGDAVSSWEQSNDGLQITMKLRPNLKLDPRPPTSGRLITTEDVKWSWDRYHSLGQGRFFFFNDLHEDAPVSSMTFPDASTVVVKLAFPASAMLKQFGTSYYFAILPLEADGKFDVRQEMRGSGAWMMTRYERGVGWTYQQNPNWYKRGDRGGPFLESLEYYLMPEPNTRLAQLEAKNLSFLAAPGNDIVLEIKRRRSEMLMTANTPFRGQSGPTLIGMSKLPDSKWEKDIRLRHALSMTIDREAYIDAYTNASSFRKLGLPFETGWHTHMGCNWPGLWLNPSPQDNKLGENAKYFHYLPDEAAKMLRAAGAFGTEDTMTYAATGQFGTPKQIETIVQMWNEGGHFKIRLNPEDYTTVITPKYTFGKGQYPDLGTHPYGGYSDWDLAMWNLFSPSGRNDIVAHHTPELQEIMVKHRRELDLKKRIPLAHEWQRRIAYHMPVVPFPGAGTTFNLHWPWLENYSWLDVAPGGVLAQEVLPYYWYNPEKDTRSA